MKMHPLTQDCHHHITIEPLRADRLSALVAKFEMSDLNRVSRGCCLASFHMFQDGVVDGSRVAFSSYPQRSRDERAE